MHNHNIKNIFDTKDLITNIIQIFLIKKLINEVSDEYIYVIVYISNKMSSDTEAHHYDDNKCPICFDNDANIIMSPCKHSICDKCFNILSKEQKIICCICRQNVDQDNNLLGTDLLLCIDDNNKSYGTIDGNTNNADNNDSDESSFIFSVNYFFIVFAISIIYIAIIVGDWANVIGIVIIIIFVLLRIVDIFFVSQIKNINRYLYMRYIVMWTFVVGSIIGLSSSLIPLLLIKRSIVSIISYFYIILMTIIRVIGLLIEFA